MESGPFEYIQSFAEVPLSKLANPQILGVPDQGSLLTDISLNDCTDSVFVVSSSSRDVGAQSVGGRDPTGFSDQPGRKAFPLGPHLPW